MLIFFFEGRVNPEQYYKNAKITCVTSTHESFSLVTLESLQNGVIPIMFNSFPAASLLINSGDNGFLVRPYNIDEYSNQLYKLISNFELYNRMYLNTIPSSLNFCPEEVYNKWVKLFSILR